MLNVTRLLVGNKRELDHLRYGGGPKHGGPAPHRRPVVVWNVTRRCNLRCIHCYAASTDKAHPRELSHEEGIAVVDDLADYGVPVLLFSGGEPLMRDRVYELMGHALKRGVHVALSTNGTMITEEVAKELIAVGVNRVGISLDGLNATNDHFRGVEGAFEDALTGIRACLAEGMTVSMRYTVTKHNVQHLDGIFRLAEKEGVPRLCIYHLAYAGRGRGLLPADLEAPERRAMVSDVFQHTVDLHERGGDMEVLTVDNHTDAPYLQLWAEEHLPERVPEIKSLLKSNGGSSTGKGIACIDEQGFVHPDQFWRSKKVGDVRERPFSEIWEDDSVPLLGQLRTRKELLNGRCPDCRFLSICNGNLRSRAEAATGDLWGDDPACYLSDEEIGASMAEAVL
jgi:Fe-coproporphyrin III synthase